MKRPTAGQWQHAYDRIAVGGFVVGFLCIAGGLVDLGYSSVEIVPAPVWFVPGLVGPFVGRWLPVLGPTGKVAEWSHGYTTLDFGGMINVDYVSSSGELLRAAGEGLSSTVLPPVVGPGQPDAEPVRFRIHEGADFEIGRKLLRHETPMPAMSMLRGWDVTVDATGVAFASAEGPPLRIPWSRVTQLAAEPAVTNLVRFAVLGDHGPVSLSFKVERKRGVFDGYAISDFVAELSKRRPHVPSPGDHPRG